MVQSNASIGSRLALTREALEMSQAELCRRIDIKSNRWNQYETGERRITVEVAILLRRELGITLDWIYEGDPSGLPNRLATRLSQRPDAAE